MKKRMIVLLLALVTVLSLSATVMAATPIIEDTEYEGKGFVDVEFTRNVRYKNAKVTVRNSEGKKMTATIVRKDHDDLTFYVKNLKAGAKYTFVISGVRAGSSGKYASVKGSFRVPSNTPLIEEIDYDGEDRELCIDFRRSVQYKNLKVTIKNSSGSVISSRVVERDSDEIELYIPRGLSYGKTYTVTISGIKARGASSYTTITGKFVAR